MTKALKAAPRPQTLETGKTPGAKQRRSDPKWKRDEREVARLYQGIDGPTDNPALKKLQTSTGRIGHLVDLRMDSISKHYAHEVKRRPLPRWIWDAWVQIQQLALDWGLAPCLVLCMADDQGKLTYQDKQRACEDLHCIAASRHARLLEIERLYEEALAEAGA